jgi:hypothetical protein
VASPRWWQGLAVGVATAWPVGGGYCLAGGGWLLLGLLGLRFSTLLQTDLIPSQAKHPADEETNARNSSS